MTHPLPHWSQRKPSTFVAALAGALLLIALPGIADTPPVALTPPVLQVLPLRDAGGIPAANGSTPLNSQLTQGLSKYLVETAAGRVLIVDAQMRIVLSKSSPDQARRSRGGNVKPQFTLEGELSHVQTGPPIDGAGGGPYFCVLRLYESAHPGDTAARRLRHQWAGLAQTYLDLTSNLRHDDRVDLEGLVGSLAKRILADVMASPTSDQAKQFAAFVATASAFKRVTARVVPEAAPLVAAEQPPLQSGDHYRLKVNSQDRGSVYLVALDSAGQPSGLFIPDSGQEIEVDADRSALVPAESPLQTGLVTKPTDRRIVILVRRTPKSAAQDVPASGRQPLANMTLPSLELDPRDTPTDTPPDAAAVQILDSTPGASTPPRPDDPGIASLLKLAATDPAGTWLAQTMTVHIVPRKDRERDLAQ